MEAPMGPDPPNFTPLLPLVPGWSRPHCRAPGREGVEAGAEGAGGGGRWRRRPRKVRPGGTLGCAQGNSARRGCGRMVYNLKASE